MLELKDFHAAQGRLEGVVADTYPLLSEYFSRQTGNTVYLKPENLQRTGSYKIRGAYNKIAQLSEDQRALGIIAASAGNHAQGVAYAASVFGAQATIVMPTSAPLVKIKRTEQLGARVILHGDVFDDAYFHALELAQQEQLCFIHPFNDEDIIAGQGTIALELIEQIPELDVIVVPVGGGGLAAGVSRAAKLINPKIRVIGVEPEGAASLKAACAAGAPVSLPSINTIADGTAVKEIGSLTFTYLKEHLNELITVADQDLIAAFLDVVEHHKIVVENSGLLSVAALKKLNCRNKRVACILSGGSMDVITMASVIQHGLLQRDRVFALSVLLPDRPGELVKVAEAIAQAQGNVIRLDHNQFVSINRLAAVELSVTIEASGSEHKERILESLRQAGYDPHLTAAHF